MFVRMFRNAVSESEDKLARRGPTPPEGPEKVPYDDGADDCNDSGGVTADAAAEDTLEDASGQQGNANLSDPTATDSNGADACLTTTAEPAELPTGDGTSSEPVNPDSSTGQPPAADPTLGDRASDAASDHPSDQAGEEPLPTESPAAKIDWPEPSRPYSGPLMAGRRRGVKGRRLARPEDPPARRTYTPEQRLLLLDTWQRSGLPTKDFAPLVGVSKHTLHKWKQQFEQFGPAGLMDRPRGGPRGSRLPELTKRTILMMKAGHPEWGCQRISDMLLRGPALAASASAVARVLHEAGYERVDEPTHRHPDKVRRFERAKPNQLWQTDLFTFVLKRQNRRVYLVAFLDDHSRFITGYGLHASQSSALVLEVLRAAIASYGSPEEILTDNGSQYVTWRGKSAFTKELDRRGIRQIVARPRRPQTLGKIERFWGTLWRECVETAVFLDLADARQRIGLFIDHYNFQRPHRGVDGLVPADRFFGAAPEVLKTLRQRVAANSLDLARHGVPKQPFYLTGQLDGQPFSVHREGDRILLRRAEEAAEEVELARPPEETSSEEKDDAPRHTPSPEPALPWPICPDGSPSTAGPSTGSEPPPPGTSVLDERLAPPVAESSDRRSPLSEEAGEQPSQDDHRRGKGGPA